MGITKERFPGTACHKLRDFGARNAGVMTFSGSGEAVSSLLSLGHYAFANITTMAGSFFA